MNRTLTVKNVEIRVDYDEIVKQFMRIASGLEDKTLLNNLIQALSVHQLESYKIEADLMDKMKIVFSNFYAKRVEDYRKSLRIKKLFGFVSDEKIEQKANKLALDDLKQLAEILTGATEKTASFRPGRVAIEQATQQLVDLIVRNANLDVNKFLPKGTEHEIR